MSPASNPPYRVLVVDDDHAVRETYQHILRPPRSEISDLEALVGGDAGSPSAGGAAKPANVVFESAMAAQGKEAATLQAAALRAGTPFQLAFIDMRMPPGWDGLQTAVALRAADPSIYIVIATAFSDYDVDALQNALGHDVVMLRKPFNQEEVFQLARTLCQSWHTRRRLEEVTAEMESQVRARTAELDARMRQQEALAELATRFIDQAASDDLDDALVWALARLGRVLDADACVLYRLNQEDDSFTVSNVWTALGFSWPNEQLHSIARADIRPAFANFQRGEVFIISGLDHLPAEMDALRARLRGHFEQVLSVPLQIHGALAGFFSIGQSPLGQGWTPEQRQLARTAAHVIARAMEVHEGKQAMAHQQAMLRATEHAAHIGNWTLRAGTLAVDWDQEIDRITGRDRPRDLVLDDLASLVDTRDWPALRASLLETLASGAPHHMEYRIRRADGETRWLASWAEAQRNARDEIILLQGMAQDISARKHAAFAMESTANFLSQPQAENFCEGLVQHAVRTLGLDYAHIGRISADGERVEVHATCLDGGRRPPWSYALRHTPCRDVLNNARPVCIESNVQARYPRDDDLRMLGAESYFGEPVLSPDGAVIGLLVGITRAPPRDSDVVQMNARLLASRAAAYWSQNAITQALREERDSSRTLLETVEAFIVALDLQGRITLINRRGCELLDHEEANLLGKDWFATCLPEDDTAQQARVLFRQALADGFGASEYHENPVRARDGAQRMIAWHNSLIRDGAGGVIGSLSTGIDVTALRAAESTVRRQTALLDHTERLSAVGGWEWDVTRQTMYWTPGTFRLHEMEETPADQDLVALSVSCYAPESRARIAQAFERCATLGEPYDLLLPFVSMRGRAMWVRTAAVAERVDGRIARVIGNLMDVTEHQHALMALQEREAAFRDLIEQQPDLAVQGYDSDGTIHFWNPGSARLYGYTQAEAVGVPVFDLIIPPALHDKVRDDIRATIASGTPRPPEDLVLRRKNGEAARVRVMYVVFIRTGAEPRLYCLDYELPKA